MTKSTRQKQEDVIRHMIMRSEELKAMCNILCHRLNPLEEEMLVIILCEEIKQGIPNMTFNRLFYDENDYKVIVYTIARQTGK